MGDGVGLDASAAMPPTVRCRDEADRDAIMAIAAILLGKGERRGERPVLKAYTFRDLLNTDFRPGHELLGHDLLERGGAMLIAGPQKVSKSFLATQAALSIMSRKPFLDIPPPPRDPNYAEDGTPHAVSALLLQGEVSDRNFKRRLRNTVAHYAVPRDPQIAAYREEAERAYDARVVFTHHAIKLDEAPALIHLAELLYDHGSDPLPRYGKHHHVPDILVIDPFAWFHGLDENSTQEMARVCAVLDRLRHGLGIAVIVVHHTAKGSSNNPNIGHKLRGSSVLSGWYETAVVAEWKGTVGGPRKISFEMRNGAAPDELICVFDPNSNTLTPVTSEDYNPLHYWTLLALTNEDPSFEVQNRTPIPDGLTPAEINARIRQLVPGHRMSAAALRRDVLIRLRRLDPPYVDLTNDPNDGEKRAKRAASGKSAAGAPSKRWFITDDGLRRIETFRRLYEQQQLDAELNALAAIEDDDPDDAEQGDPTA